MHFHRQQVSRDRRNSQVGIFCSRTDAKSQRATTGRRSEGRTQGWVIYQGTAKKRTSKPSRVKTKNSIQGKLLECLA